MSLTLEEAAERADLSSKTLRRAIAAGELRAARVGRRITVDEGALEQYLSDRCGLVAPLPARLLRPVDAAAYLAISPATLDRLRSAGDVRALKIGGATRYDVRDLDAFVDRCRS